jgi:hypothetical protein
MNLYSMATTGGDCDINRLRLRMMILPIDHWQSECNKIPSDVAEMERATEVRARPSQQVFGGIDQRLQKVYPFACCVKGFSN